MKQMILMRIDTDPKMRKGKMIAQGAHASLAATLEHLGDPRVQEWLAGQFTKVCVQVTEEELDEAVTKAFEAGVIFRSITDSGKTEFDGVPTVTCAAIGPDTPEKLEPITGKLRLL